MTSTDENHRADVIAGLRALADFLDANPAVPVAGYGWDVSVHPGDTDEEAHTEVNKIAELLNVTPTDERERGGHYIATKTFGPIAYRAVHVTAHHMAAREALMSYAPAFPIKSEAA